MTTREFAIEHLRKKREHLIADGKRFVRHANDARLTIERYEQLTIETTQQIESIDALLAEVGVVIDG